ncbi:MAG: glyoxylate/hydroxypyruvate reductase A [Rhodospirillaceae bacterium]|nr:glyoxylate/hydroxypyruvate reductase A [Rhodospirillaceae bacterium]|tara:strand:+ start:2711 stop:3631 length:921 start_codon:yes stop_codon:yes gene_type:complete
MIKLGEESPDDYISELLRLDSSLDICEWPNYGDPTEIDIAMVWQLPHGELAKLPNLKLIISMAAGVDHILSDPARPVQVPVVRVTDPHMARSMGHWFLMNILRLHRETSHYDELRQKKIWAPERSFDTDSVRVGILGLGYLGTHVAKMLKSVGFYVQGWSRTEKEIEGIPSFTGSDGLSKMLASTNFLACLLPDTDSTKGIMNTGLFHKMPIGSYVLNAGRGAQLVEDDLLKAIDGGQLKGAALDVFSTEPLPKKHPFWSDERIIITPHHAAEVFVPSAAKMFVENIHRSRLGKPLIGLVNQELGY